MINHSKTNNYTGFLIVILAFIAILMPLKLFAGKGDSDQSRIKVVAVGDLYLGGDGERYVSQNDYAYSYLNIMDELNSADVSVANLEVPLTTEDKQFMEKTYILKARPDAIRSVQKAGFDVVTLANNHIMDYGPTGLTETLAILDKNNIKRTGAGVNLEEARKEAVVEVKGKRIAFLSYSLTYPVEFYAGTNRGGTAPGHMAHVLSDIRRVKAQNDFVIVSFHWGAEMMRTPKYYQKENAHLCIEAGANVVIGHHPHVIQSVERYKDGVVFYSMGNFVFGSMTRRVPSGLMAIIELDARLNKLSSVELIPLNVYNREVYFSPKKFEGRRLKEAYDDIRTVSSEFKRNTAFYEDNNRLFVDLGKENLSDKAMTSSNGLDNKVSKDDQSGDETATAKSALSSKETPVAVDSLESKSEAKVRMQATNQPNANKPEKEQSPIKDDKN